MERLKLSSIGPTEWQFLSYMIIYRSVKNCQIKWDRGSTLIKLCGHIIYLSSKDVVTERLIVSFLYKMIPTSEPPETELNKAELLSLRTDTFDAVQLSISFIFTPTGLFSRSQESNLNAAFQLSSINCMNSLRETMLSPSLSYALKVSIYKLKYNLLRFHDR